MVCYYMMSPRKVMHIREAAFGIFARNGCYANKPPLIYLAYHPYSLDYYFSTSVMICFRWLCLCSRAVVCIGQFKECKLCWEEHVMHWKMHFIDFERDIMYR